MTADDPNQFRVTLMLCDHCAVAEGKLYVNGGGWTQIGPAPSPFALAIVIEVPWSRANEELPFELRLVRSDGEPVMQAGPSGPEPTVFHGSLEAGRPAGLAPGTHIPLQAALNFGPMSLPAGERLMWELWLNGQRVEIAPFNTRPWPITPQP